MLPSPSSSPLQPPTLYNSTNLRRKGDEDDNRCKSSHPWLQLPTPPTNTKRPFQEEDNSPSKRAKLTDRYESRLNESEETLAERAGMRFRRSACPPLSMARNNLPSYNPILNNSADVAPRIFELNTHFILNLSATNSSIFRIFISI